MKVLLTILTHGDEKIGLRVAREIKRLQIDRKSLAIQVANKKAYAAGKRFIDADLNRSFPGKKNGNYEERIAYRLSPQIKEADLVIDIHSTRSLLKDALIVSKLNRQTQNYVDVIQPKYVLVLKATKNSTLIAQAKAGVAFEYGRDNDPATLKKIVRDIKRVLQYLNLQPGHLSVKKTATIYFNVRATVEKPKGYILLKNIKNYKLVPKGKPFARKGGLYLIAKKDFYPILFGNNTYPKYFGFRAEKV